MERLLGLSAENRASNVLRRFAVQEDGGEDMWMEALELCGYFGFRDGAEAILRARSKRWPEEARRHAVDTAAFLAVDGYPTKNVFVKIFRRKKNDRHNTRFWLPKRQKPTFSKKINSSRYPSRRLFRAFGLVFLCHKNGSKNGSFFMSFFDGCVKKINKN